MRALLFSTALAAVLATTGAAGAADATFKFDYGAVAASGRQITVTRLPVTLPSGKVVLEDVTILMRADSAGKLRVVAGYPLTEASVEPETGALAAGDYAPPSNLDYRLTLAGPSLGANGRPQWILDRDGDDVSLRFYGGALAGHPLESRIAAIGATAGWTYGVVDGGKCDLGCNVKVGDLVALSTGTDGQIYLQDLTTDAGVDRAVPVRTLALRPCTASACG